MLNDPLLQRELWSQARRQYPSRGWTYPGPVWFLVLTLLPLVWWWKVGPESDSSLRTTLVVAGVLQSFLLALRSTLYCSVSMAYEVRQNTLAVLRSTPLSLLRAQIAKLIACLLPLWLELALLLVFNLAVYSWFGGIAVAVSTGLVLFLGTVTLLFGCFGLWLGSVVPDPEKAAGNARGVVLMLMPGTFVLEQLLSWPMLLVAGLIWICLVVQPQVRPGRAYQGGVAALILLLLLPLLYTFAQSGLHRFELSAYNPMCAVGSLAAERPAPHLLAAELKQAREDAEARGLRDEQSLERLAGTLSVEEVQRRATWHLLPTGVLYLLMAGVFFQLSYSRSKHCY